MICPSCKEQITEDLFFSTSDNPASCPLCGEAWTVDYGRYEDADYPTSSNVLIVDDAEGGSWYEITLHPR